MANWFYKHGEKSIGPVEEATMHAWITEGTINPTHLVRKEGAAEWRRADVCVSEMSPTSKAPDLLARISRRYFECEGLCFIPVFEVVQGMCRVSLYYQNRFGGWCDAKIELMPFRNQWGRRPSLEPFSFEVKCSGGEVGVIRRFYGINARWQGKNVAYKIGGKATYAAGNGELLRLERGSVVEPFLNPKLGFSMLMIALLSGGRFHVKHKPAAMWIRLPSDVEERVRDGMQDEMEILGMSDSGGQQPESQVRSENV